jgi:hypothetical protein
MEFKAVKGGRHLTTPTQSEGLQCKMQSAKCKMGGQDYRNKNGFLVFESEMHKRTAT